MLSLLLMTMGNRTDCVVCNAHPSDTTGVHVACRITVVDTIELCCVIIPRVFVYIGNTIHISTLITIQTVIRLDQIIAYYVVQWEVCMYGLLRSREGGRGAHQVIM